MAENITQWSYWRALTDSNATAVTDYAVRIDLTSSNFTFANAVSDGSDVRIYNTTLDEFVPYWIKSWDSVGETAEIWFRTEDMSDDHRIYYGNATASNASYGGDVFNIFESFSNDPVGSQPSRYADDNSTSETDTVFTKIGDANGNQDAGYWYSLSSSADLNANSGTRAVTASRIPKQNSGFYGQGRYWRFFGDFDIANDPGPYDFCFTSSLDGVTWETTTVETAGGIPVASAQFSIDYDTSANKVYVCRNIQSNGIFHDGCEFRRGTPNSNGTISWDDTWQTVVPAGSKLGDISIAVLTDGKVVIGGEDDTSYIVYKSSTTDGTWTTASGYPLTVRTTDATNPPSSLVVALNAGEYYVLSASWDLDAIGVGFNVSGSDSSPVVTEEPGLTELPIEADSGSNAKVPRMSAISVGGVVHYAYQTSSQSVRYGSRSTDGTFIDEIEVTDGVGYVGDTNTFPVPVVDGNGDIHVMWGGSWFYGTVGDTHALFCAKIVESGSSGAQMVKIDSNRPDYSHIIPDVVMNGQNASIAYLDNSYVLKNIIVACPATLSAVNQSLHAAKNVNASMFVYAGSGLGDGFIYELDFYATSLSTGGDTNDHYEVLRLSNSGRTNTAALIGAYGDNAGTGGDYSFGYISGGHIKGIAGIDIGTWYRVGAKIRSGDVYDIYIDDALVATDAGVVGGVADYSTFQHGGISTHYYDVNVDNVRVRPWVATEPVIVVGDENSQSVITTTVTATNAAGTDAESFTWTEVSPP